MAKINLESLTVEQLAQLQADAATLMAAKQQEQSDALRATIKAMVKDAGHDVVPFLRSMLPSKSTSKKSVQTAGKRSKPAVKYRKGSDTWTGRGHRPQWLTKHLEGGGTLDQVAV